MDKPPKDEKKAKGGIARAKALTPEKKKEIAEKGAAARWGARVPQCTHKGNFETDFGIDVECYVLDDAAKTAVISQRGMGIALGLKDDSGRAFPRFLSGKAITNALGVELLKTISNPLIFNGSTPGAGLPPMTVHGYDVTILIDICKAIVRAEAEDKLLASQADIAKQAHVILSASAKAGIKGLVYALSGYDATREEVVQAFKAFVQEEARKYEKEFPPELYAEWYRLYEIPKPERGRPWGFKHLTLNHVYWPLAKSDGKLLELLRVARSNNGESGKKLFSFLNEVGARALRMHLGRILEMAESSSSKDEYLRKIVDRFGGQQEMDLGPTAA